MSRFFIDPQDLSGNSARLVGQDARHISVLRLRPGEEVTLCTADGRDHLCRIDQVSSDLVDLTVLRTVPSQTEPRLQADIFMAYAKADKLEHVIQKATELGARRIIAFPSARCVSRPEEKSLPKKLERWQSIARSAAEQSGRGIIPQVLALSRWQEALELAAKADLGLFFYENETNTHLTQLMAQRPASLSIVTGPEGGFTPQEVSQAVSAGLHSCSLGPRILRCETAPLCALSAALYAAGDL